MIMSVMRGLSFWTEVQEMAESPLTPRADLFPGSLLQTGDWCREDVPLLLSY